jgi:uncharacterized protein YdbL (DUF1318 family)
MKKIFFMLAFFISTASLFLLGCYMKTEHKIEAHITIDIRELKETATQIEDMVRAKKAKGQSLFILPWKVDAAYAEMQIKFMTPDVEKAITNRGARLDRLEELMKKGCIGENNSGYVEYRPCPDCEKDAALIGEAKKNIKDENIDRRTIYQTIVEQNNLGADKLCVVEKVFSETQRKNAPQGSYIQQDDGTWIKK